MGDNVGCIDTACITVNVRALCNGINIDEIPNIFTPNNDGNNDVFYLEGWEDCIETFEMTVYNRWGVKIFESTNVYMEWDGRISNGLEAPDGTYYYIFNIKDGSGEHKKYSGFITLVR